MSIAKDISQLMPQTTVSFGASHIITATGTLFDHVKESGFMWEGDGDRLISGRVIFTKPYKQPPAVNVHIVGMDSDQSANLRYWLNATEIGPLAFTIEFKTWGNTRIARAGVSWTAIGR